MEYSIISDSSSKRFLLLNNFFLSCVYRTPSVESFQILEVSLNFKFNFAYHGLETTLVLLFDRKFDSDSISKRKIFHLLDILKIGKIFQF